MKTHVYLGAALARQKFISPEDSLIWFRTTSKKRGFASMPDFADHVGINKGNIYRYFAQQQRPRITVVPVLCNALRVSPAALLGALGVMPLK
jgi:DNA-binding phage protein